MDRGPFGCFLDITYCYCGLTVFGAIWTAENDFREKLHHRGSSRQICWRSSPTPNSPLSSQKDQSRTRSGITKSFFFHLRLKWYFGLVDDPIGRRMFVNSDTARLPFRMEWLGSFAESGGFESIFLQTWWLPSTRIPQWSPQMYSPVRTLSAIPAGW